MAQLVVIKGAKPGQVFKLDKDEMLIGRSNAVDIQLLDRSVSRNHATIRRRYTGKFVLFDNNSSYGTFLDGERIEQADISDGAVIKVGSTILEMSLSDDEKQAQQSFEEALVNAVGQEDDCTIVHVYSEKDEAVSTLEGRSAADRLLEAGGHFRTAFEISQSLMSTFDESTLYGKIIEAVISTLRVERVVVTGVPKTDSGVEVKVARNIEQPGRNIRFSQNIVKRVVQTSQSLLLESSKDLTDLDTANNIFEKHICSGMCVPIGTNDQVYGTIYAESSGAELFSKTDLQLLTLLGNLSAVAIKNSRAIKAYKDEACSTAVANTVEGLSTGAQDILQSLKSGAFMLHDGIKNQDMGMILAALPSLEIGLEKMNEIVMNMMEYSTTREVEYGIVDLNKTIDTIYEQVAQRAKAERIEIEIEKDYSIPVIAGDSIKIYLAVLNIVTLAMDRAADSDSGKVTVTLSEDEENDEVVVRVIDNGKMAPDVLPLGYYDAFSTGESKIKFGLELAITGKIIKTHNGVLEVESTPNANTIFHIKLPVNQPEK